MKQIRTLIILLLLSCFTPAMAETAQQLLNRAAEKIRTSPSIKIGYAISASSGNTTGTMTLAGDKFVMSSPEIKIWYDGTTQWSYLISQGEVNITEPTADELQQVNPLVIINRFRNSYTSAFVKTDAKNVKKILLTSKSKNADISSATITINTTTLLPTAIVITLRSGQKMTINVNSATVGSALQVSTFRFPTKTYPNVELIDLR